LGEDTEIEDKEGNFDEDLCEDVEGLGGIEELLGDVS
jgi:hypothetical protein